MKRVCALILVLLTVLPVPCVRAEAAPEIHSAAALAEKALRQPLDDVPAIGDDAPMVDDLYLCGPFLYLAPTDSDRDEVFIPDQDRWDYEPQWLPTGAEIRADETLVSAEAVPEGARAVFPLLFSPGYYEGAVYTVVGRVDCQAFAALLIDRKTGEAVAWVEDKKDLGTPQFLPEEHCRKDMNDRYVFWYESIPKTRKAIWNSVFGSTTGIGYVFYMEDGEVTGAPGKIGGELVIPEGVTGIAYGAFRDRNDIQTIRFPKSLEYIGPHAFDSCEELRELEVPGNVGRIKNDAFSSCRKLERVTLNEGVGMLHHGCFSECTKLEEIRLPDSLYEIEEGCFSGCVSLSEITIPKNLDIPASCFSGCSALRSVAFVGDGADLGDHAFSDCASLQHIDLPRYTFRIGDGSFSGCTALQSVGINGTILHIGAGAFENCGALQSLSFINRTASVGEGAFRGCDSLESISFDVTRRYAAQKWDRNWKEGCTAEIRWKRDLLPPILGAAAAVIGLAAAVVIPLRKKRQKKSAAPDSDGDDFLETIRKGGIR